MIPAWVVLISCIVVGVIAAAHIHHESKKAYNKGFHDAMAARIIAINKEGKTAYGIEWEQDDDGRQ